MSVGAIDRVPSTAAEPPKQLQKISCHQYLGDTLDGGLPIYLTGPETQYDLHSIVIINLYPRPLLIRDSNATHLSANCEYTCQNPALDLLLKATLPPPFEQILKTTTPISMVMNVRGQMTSLSSVGSWL